MILLEPSDSDECWSCDSDKDVRDVVFEKDTDPDHRRPLSLCIDCRLELHDVTEPDGADAGVADVPAVREIAF